MKVKDLIKKLQECKPDADVVINIDCSDLSDDENIDISSIHVDDSMWINKDYMKDGSIVEIAGIPNKEYL